LGSFLTLTTVLHFWGFTIHTGEVESALLSLPYVANAIVLPLADKEYKERAAAIVQIEPSCKSNRPSFEALRNDLTEQTGLMLFKLPTVIYWLQDGEEISLTVNGKISKVDARKKFFGDEWRGKEGVEVLDLSTMEYWRMGGQC
jgi:acyl-coenzyme A synthetase/AMP-(fatty) acid ligase